MVCILLNLSVNTVSGFAKPLTSITIFRKSALESRFH
jgi:hypothetical protein